MSGDYFTIFSSLFIGQKASKSCGEADMVCANYNKMAAILWMFAHKRSVFLLGVPKSSDQSKNRKVPPFNAHCQDIR